MKDLDITTIVNRVRALSNSSPMVLKGLNDTDTELDASMIAATIVGGAIGTHCPIPPRHVPLSGVYFATTYGSEVQEVLSRINESVTIRTQVAYDAAVAMWTDRYDMVHRPCNLDTLLMRLSIAGESELANTNFTRPLMTALDDEQRGALDAITRSINLSCAEANIRNRLFDK